MDGTYCYALAILRTKRTESRSRSHGQEELKKSSFQYGRFLWDIYYIGNLNRGAARIYGAKQKAVIIQCTLHKMLCTYIQRQRGVRQERQLHTLHPWDQRRTEVENIIVVIFRSYDD